MVGHQDDGGTRAPEAKAGWGRFQGPEIGEQGWRRELEVGHVIWRLEVFLSTSRWQGPETRYMRTSPWDPGPKRPQPEGIRCSDPTVRFQHTKKLFSRPYISYILN